MEKCGITFINTLMLYVICYMLSNIYIGYIDYNIK